MSEILRGSIEGNLAVMSRAGEVGIASWMVGSASASTLAPDVVVRMTPSAAREVARHLIEAASAAEKKAKTK